MHNDEFVLVLPNYAARDDLYGWVSGKDVPDVQKLLEENARLKAELENNKRKQAKGAAAGSSFASI